MKRISRKLLWIAVALAIVFLVLALFRHWQGPKLAAYEVTARPLVQTVVATG